MLSLFPYKKTIHKTSHLDKSVSKDDFNMGGRKCRDAIILEARLKVHQLTTLQRPEKPIFSWYKFLFAAANN